MASGTDTTADPSATTTPAAATGDTESSAPGTDGSAPDATGFPQPEGEPDTEATFIDGYAITVSRLDPHRASISQDATTLFPVYDRLVRRGTNPGSVTQTPVPGARRAQLPLPEPLQPPRPPQERAAPAEHRRSPWTTEPDRRQQPGPAS